MMPRKLLLFLSYSNALTIAALSAPSVRGRQTSDSPKLCSRLVIRVPPRVHITPVLRYLHWLPIRARICYKIACLCFNPITSSTPAYLSDLLQLSSPRSIRSSADTSIRVRRKVIVLSLTLVFHPELIATAH